MNISTFTTMTNPEERGDPWKEALTCYESYSDEIIKVGLDWPYEFKFDIVGKFFQEGFNKSTGDWAFRMDIDYFFHEKDLNKLKRALKKNEDMPAIAFPQYQFFTPDRYQVKTRLCIALNKKRFPQIKLNGGGDKCLATINNKIINFREIPNVNIPIYQYDSMFRTREIIAEDRARFARAWFREFNDYGDRGGPGNSQAFDAWFSNINKKYLLHTHKIKLNNHPTYIKDKLLSLDETHFGYDAFGLRSNTSRQIKNYIKGYKEKYFNTLIYKIS